METVGAVQEFWRGFVEGNEDQEEELEEQLVDTSEIEDVRSLERFLGEMPGISRKEAKRLASIKTETAQPSRDAEEEAPELTVEQIREIVRGEFVDTMADVRNEVSDILNDALGKVRVH